MVLGATTPIFIPPVILEIPHMHPRAICFDMDGTLVDSEPCHAYCTRELLKRMKIPLDVLDWDVTGYPDEILLAEIIRRNKLKMTVAQLKARKMQWMAKHLDRVKPMPGALELLTRVWQRGIPTAIVSASGEALMRMYLDHFGWTKHFTAIVSGTSPAIRHNKPAPDVYRAAAFALNLPPQHCMAIEDSFSGLCSARTAGMNTIGIRNGQNGHQDFRHAQQVVEGLEEVARAIVARPISKITPKP